MITHMDDVFELTGAPVLTSAIFFVSVWKYVRENKFMILIGIYFCRQKKKNDGSAVDILRTFGGRGSNRATRTILPGHVHILDVQNSTSAFFDVHKFRNFGFLFV